MAQIIGGIIGLVVGIVVIIAGLRNTPMAVQGNGRRGVMSGTGVVVIGVVVAIGGIASLVAGLV
jgi:hypothetical protein